MRTLSSGVCTTVWLHHLDFNEMLGEIARLELHKDAVCCFQQMLKVAHSKSIAVQPYTSHLTNHPSKMCKICWALLEN